MKNEYEHKIQCACVKWFRYRYPQYSGLFFAVPNGGARNAVTAGKLKAEGVLSGVADLLCLVPFGGYNYLAIEMKTMRKGSRRQPSQKAFQEAVERFGGKYAVCRSFDEFVETVDGYFYGQTK